MYVVSEDPLQRRLEKLRKITDATVRRSELYGDIAKMGRGMSGTPLRPLRKASAPGKKIQKIGFIMFWIPEPTGVTCAVGAPMILAGRYLDKKYNSSTVNDIGGVTEKTLSGIRDFKKTAM